MTCQACRDGVWVDDGASWRGVIRKEARLDVSWRHNGVSHVGASFRLEKMYTFPPVLSGCMSQCQIHYNLLKVHNNISFCDCPDTRHLDANGRQLQFPLGLSRRRKLCNKIPILFQTFLSYIQETLLPIKTKPAQRGPRSCWGWRRRRASAWRGRRVTTACE